MSSSNFETCTSLENLDTLEFENFKLKKQLKTKEIEFCKDKSLLIQQVDQLNERLRNMEKREHKLRKDQQILTCFIEKINAI